MQQDEEIDLTRCACDECARKKALLQSLDACEGSLPDSLDTSGISRKSKLRQDLASHSRRAALARRDDGGPGDRLAIRKPNAKRSWLTYDPDALMPQPFDAFLFGGGCRGIAWPDAASVRDRSLVKLDVSLCYVVGCGRSGTTVFSEIMSRYAGIVFVNEPRQLWIPLLPAMDVWSVAAPARQGRLCFAPEEALALRGDGGETTQTVAKLAMDAYCDIAELAASPPPPEGQTARQCIVVEKFPEHSFRLPLLARICTEELGPRRCTFLHIIRDGVETARSIAAIEDPAAWYGVRKEWKWRCLRELILPSAGGSSGSGGGFGGTQPPRCQLDLSEEFIALLDRPRGDRLCRFARGLADWAASVLMARQGAEQAEGSEYMEIRYEDLVSNPGQVLAGLRVHLDLEPSAAARQVARRELTARIPRPLDAVEREVLLSLRGSRVEQLLRESGRELPH